MSHFFVATLTWHYLVTSLFSNVPSGITNGIFLLVLKCILKLKMHFLENLVSLTSSKSLECSNSLIV